MTKFNKILGGVAAVAAVTAATVSTPAVARDRDDGIGAGEIIAGALVIGGIAAIAAAASDNDDGYRNRRYDDRYYRGNNNYYNRRGYNANGYRNGSRDAINQCVHATERRTSYRNGRANVTNIRDIDRTRRGYKIKGRLAVEEYRGRYGQRGYDQGSFTCRVEYGRVTDIDIRGIR